MQHMMCFTLPALLCLLSYPAVSRLFILLNAILKTMYNNQSSTKSFFAQVQMFVDATFRIVPHPFYQCLIVMVFDASLKIYIPVAWILMTGKTEECYWQTFN